MERRIRGSHLTFRNPSFHHQASRINTTKILRTFEKVILRMRPSGKYYSIMNKLSFKKLETVIKTQDTEALEGLLKLHKKTAEKRLIAQTITNFYEEEKNMLWPWFKRLLNHRFEEVRDVGVMLLPQFYQEHKEEVKNLLLKMADDSCWWVRETVAGAFARVWAEDFEGLFPLYEKWRKHPSENVRRALLMATSVRKYLKVEKKIIERLLKFLEPLLYDKSRYVRVNLGPFRIGSSLLPRYPKIVFKYLWRWLKIRDENVRWNLAMSVSSSGGVKYPEESLRLLRELALDERRFVWRAVVSALRSLGKKHPELVKSEMKKWLKDSRRKTIAETVLKII